MKTHVHILLFALSISAGLFFNQTLFGEVENTTKPIKDEPKIITDKNIVAIVNGQKIPRQELYNLLFDAYGEEALEILIRRTIIYQTAQKEGISVTNSEIEQKLKTLVNNEIDASMRAYRIKDRADFEKELAKNGINLAHVEEKISKKMRKQAELEVLTEKIIAKTITITEEELQKTYDEVYGEKIDASQIVFKTRREAEDALKKLQSGADFATLAKNESIDRASAVRGGKMQPFSPKDSMGIQVAHLKVGELSDIIKMDYGYHIIKIANKKAASNKGFKTVRGELEKIARNQYYKERLGPWLINLIENASITKNLATD